MELRYILSGFGIPSDNLPLTWSGTIKLTYTKQWMRLRQFIEEPSLSSAAGYSYHSDMIECPSMNDIIFRQGTSSMSHPGNATLRDLVESKWKELETRINNNNQSQKTTKRKSNPSLNVKTRSVVMEVIEDITRRYRGRFLTWNDKMGWWSQMNDPEQIYFKMEHIVRDVRRFTKQEEQAGQRRQNEENKKTKVLSAPTSSHIQQITLQSSTSMFQFDRGEKMNCNPNNICRENKRQRVVRAGDLIGKESLLSYVSIE